MNRNKKQPTALGIIIKSLILSFLVFILGGIMIFTITYVFIGDYETSEADIVNGCNGYYYEKEYGELRNYLLLFDAFGENYDMYWEIVDGYGDYMQYVQWSSTSEDDVSGSSEMAEHYRKKVEENVNNCKFSQNEEQLRVYLDEVNN